MAKPKHVLHVMNASAGGAALSTIALIGGLADKGIRSSAVCHDMGTSQEHDRLREAVEGRVLFTRLYWWNHKTIVPLWRRPLSELKQMLLTGWSYQSAARVAECAQRWGVDLIHTNTILTPEGAMVARQRHLPHIWHLRELVGPGNPYRLPVEGPAFGRYMAANCSKLVANSNTSAQQIGDWLPEGLLEIIPNGIDISRFHPRSTPRPTNRLVVGMVGNITSRWKKHGLFVETAIRVDRSLPIEWRIYGHDPSQGGKVSDVYVDKLHKRLAAADLSDRFVWPGFHSDPAEIMSQIDVLLHPASNESFGRVIVEAMASGLPVVGVRAGGVNEIVQHEKTGLLAAVDDADQLAVHIERLAREPELRAALGQAGRDRALNVYSLQACVDHLTDVYEQAMSHPLSNSPSQPVGVS